MELDMGKRRSLAMALAVLILMGFTIVGAATGLFVPVAQWVHEAATATLPINDPVYMYNQALQFDADGNSAYAVAAAKRAIIIEPGYAAPHRFLAAKYLKNHDFADAAQECKGLLGDNPNDASALLGLASAYSGLGETKQSEEIYRRVMENTVNTELVRDAAERSLNALDHGVKPGAAGTPAPMTLHP